MINYGIKGRVYSVLKSFLTGTSMKVVVNGQSSDIYLLNSGVPKGSVLGPTLFLLFINGLPYDVLASFIDMFAEDTTK